MVHHWLAPQHQGGCAPQPRPTRAGTGDGYSRARVISRLLEQYTNFQETRAHIPNHNLLDHNSADSRKLTRVYSSKIKHLRVCMVLRFAPAEGAQTGNLRLCRCSRGQPGLSNLAQGITRCDSHVHNPHSRVQFALGSIGSCAFTSWQGYRTSG